MNPWNLLIQAPIWRPKAENPPHLRALKDLPWIENPWNLTRCQIKMLGLAIDGLNNTEIADKLGLSSKTVDTHFTCLYGRMEAVEQGRVNRARAAVLWDRFVRGVQ